MGAAAELVRARAACVVQILLCQGALKTHTSPLVGVRYNTHMHTVQL